MIIEDNDKKITDSTQQTTPTPEEPIIMIERIEEPSLTHSAEKQQEVVLTTHHFPKWGVWLFIVIIALLALILFLLVGRKEEVVVKEVKTETPVAEPELPQSATAEESTEKLQATEEKVEQPGITMTEDAINDVKMRLYAINGLKAELTFNEPDTNDESVYLYSHSADVRADNGKIVCACVVAGEQISEGNNRSGYFAAVGDNMVIGVAYNDSVLNYAKENGGFFFRQFAIVSDGQIGDIRLKGKTQRNALGFKDGQLYYVETSNSESLYDFAEALCDYGFTDALYITGGKVYNYYRDSQGKRHDMNYKAKEGQTRILNSELPFLVFRAP